eukprot:TRINITY_DN5023_c0_g1_i1.p1 TRINITY_DN5023_c0_g1~~TRINITY_DN5023_c0_g1_i1.p1  ORF type:complete len:763 (+),score=154.94 TRINITY_DN5023_c0_g1_i1:281-2569(+)
MSLAITKQKFSVRTNYFLTRALHASSSVFNKPSSQIDFSKSIEDFKKNGIAILPVKIDDEFVWKSRKLCMSAWVDALARGKIVKGHEVKLGQEHGFKEIVLRAPGRYDMQWKIDGEKHFLDEEKVLSKFMPFVHEVLGGQQMTKLNFNGCLMSLPGAKEQLWHIDGEHLFSSEENFKCNGKDDVEFFQKTSREPDAILPAHCLNIFVPLVDVESNNGGTEFCLGSQFHTKFFSDDIVWQDSRWKERIDFKGDVLAIKVNAGEVLAFDYRVLHRALEHGGKEVRPLLYYTFTKRWFSDAMNFADLPSLTEADGKLPMKMGEDWRQHFPSILKDERQVFCDGAAGSQVPEVVISRMRDHLMEVGCSNVGGDYPTSQKVLNVVSKARAAGRDLLGAKKIGEIAFGLNCSNLMFHLARSMESNLFSPGDNILLSRACHDANIAPWLHLAKNAKMEVRWLETSVSSNHSDKIDIDKISGLIDEKTRVISLGLASNATGRIHLDVVKRINEISETFSTKPFLILDATHFVPHRRCHLEELQADAILCSAYKFFGPHIGIMAYNKKRLEILKPSKVGLRFAEDGLIERDVLDPGDVPTLDNCEISRWEMGTLNYEGLAGFEACVDYIASLAGEMQTSSDRSLSIDLAYVEIQKHEELLSNRFLSRIQPLLDQNVLNLFGSRESQERTPTFAISLSDVAKSKIGSHDPYYLVKKLNERNIFCTHGNHYAVELVENSLKQVEGVTRISFLHYNTVEEVDRVVDELENILEL